MNAPMATTFSDVRLELERQLEHWRQAALRLSDLDSVAPAPAWQSLEHYLGVSLRQTLDQSLARLRRAADAATSELATVSDENDLSRARARIMDLRQRYLRVETTIDFYADALATRAVPRMGALLRACDHMATTSMAEVLRPLGRQVPAALTYLDAGLGASILKAGLRLWDGTAENPVATIKVTRHNLLRPTSVLHEAGHQVAHMLGWNDELAARLQSCPGASPRTAEVWSGWAAEVAGDAVGFAFTGYAAVAALHDVVDGGRAKVFAFLPYDPHPTSYLRVRLGIAMCRAMYGAGPWDRLESAWCRLYPLDSAPSASRNLVEESVAVLPRITAIILQEAYRAFGGRPLTALIDPMRVSPGALAELERAAGRAAFSSPYWIWNEAIRLLALTGYRAALGSGPMREALVRQERWMLAIGRQREAA